MSDHDDGGPAFPGDYQGMSLRDWFAGQALVGMLGKSGTDGDRYEFAYRAYLIADAMLLARSRFYNQRKDDENE